MHRLMWRSAPFGTATALRALAEQAGFSVTAVRGAIHNPAVGLLARILAPIDSRLGLLTTVDAAFIAVEAAERPSQ